MKPLRPIRRVSDKRRKELAEYVRLKKLFFGQFGLACDVDDCHRPASDVHHVRGRGKLLNETKYWKAVCRHHHRQIHDNPEWARSVGLLAPKGKWLNP